MVVDPASTIFALFPFLPQALMHPNDDAALRYCATRMALFSESARHDHAFGNHRMLVVGSHLRRKTLVRRERNDLFALLKLNRTAAASHGGLQPNRNGQHD
jgi:hypothetical protein